MPQPPQLTREQRIEHLAIACAARKRRVHIKQQLTEGYLTLFDVIQIGKKDETIGRLKPVDVLKCIPGIGTTTAQRIVKEAGIAPTRRIRGLGRFQIASLIDATRFY